MQARSALNSQHRGHISSGSSQAERPATSSQGRLWFPEQSAAVDEPLREIVAHRFMSMNEEHDRIRMQLLASHPSHDD